MSIASQIKAGGVHYTPPGLAVFLAQSMAREITFGEGFIAALDPACGDGELLEALFHAVPPDVRGRLELHGYETDPAAIVRAEIRLRRLGVAKIALHTVDFLLVEGVEGSSLGQQLHLFGGLRGGCVPQRYDAVITNPPYVRTQVLGARKAQELALRFDLTGRVDLYQAFIKGVSAVLKPGGTVGLLTSNRFLTVKAGAAMRDLLAAEFDLRTIYDLGDTKLFPAAVLPAIVVARKGSPHSGAQCEFVRVYEDREDGRTRLPAPEYTSVLDALRSQVRGAVLSPQGRYTIERGTLADPGVSDAPWQLATPENRDWLEIIEANQSGCFADVAKIRVGIKSTADRVFIRDDWGMLPVEQRPEADLLRPLITHHIANRWAARPTTKQVLYPHAVEGGKRVAINLASFPHARTYFEAHRVILESRKYVIESGRRWYEIWVPQAPEDWSSPKVVFPDISEEPRFLLDESGAVVNGDCYWATLKRGQDPRFLALMLAVANSSLIKKYYDIVFHNKLYAGRRRFMAQYVSKFPLPRLDSPSVARLLEIVGRLTKGSETVAVVEDLELELNALVWQSFGIIEEVSG